MNLRKPNDINKYVADDELTHEGFENCSDQKIIYNAWNEESSK